MRAFSPATPPARRPTSVVAFNPASISGLRSRLLDAATFTSPISSKYYLADSSTVNTHLPRQGRAWLFDGTNDYATLGARVTSGAVSAMTLSGWVSRTGASVMMLLTEAGSGTSGWHVQLNSSAGGDIRLYFPDNTSFGVTASGLISTSALTHFAIVFDGSGSLNTDRLKIYINGSLASLSFTGTIPSSIASHANSFDVGAFNRGGQFFNRSICDVRIYNVAKTAGEITAIYNQSRTGSGTFDSTGLLAAYPCNEESGTTGYDISGNGRHLTLTNITQATFHAADTGVLANRNNAEGYRLSGSVYIPKRLTDSLAADGNALTVTGRAAYHGCVETPCLTGDGSSVYANLGSPLFPATADFSFKFWYFPNNTGNGILIDQRVLATNNQVCTVIANIAGAGTLQLYVGDSPYSTVTSSALTAGTWNLVEVTRVGNSWTLLVNGVSAGTVSNSVSIGQEQSTLLGFSAGASLYSTGRVSNIEVTVAGVTTYFPLQDGPGSSNTNRDIAWVKSDGTGGIISNAIVNGTVSTIWVNRVPGNVEDWCIKYGGRIAANGAFVAGMLTGGNAADGSAKTLAAGKFGNPFSRLNLNPATAAELNGRSVPTAAVVAADINATITPTQSAFRRSKTDGDDRFLIYDDTLSGADLTNVQEYIA